MESSRHPEHRSVSMSRCDSQFRILPDCISDKFSFLPVIQFTRLYDEEDNYSSCIIELWRNRVRLKMFKSIWFGSVNFISTLKYRIISSFLHLLSIYHVCGIIRDTDYILLAKQTEDVHLGSLHFARKIRLLQICRTCGLFKSKAIIFCFDKFYHRNKHTNKTGKNSFSKQVIRQGHVELCFSLVVPL